MKCLHCLSAGFVRNLFKDHVFVLGVPTVPLLPPQVNQSLTSVPPMNPATTLPGKQQDTRAVCSNNRISNIVHLKKTVGKILHLSGDFLCLLISFYLGCNFVINESR